MAHGAPVARRRRARGRRRWRRSPPPSAGYLGTPDDHAARRGRPIRRSSRGCAGSPAPSIPSALSAGTPLATMVTRAGALDVAATTDAEHAALGATADRFDASYPEPSMWLEAVLAVPDGPRSPTTLGDRRHGRSPRRRGTAPSAATQPLPERVDDARPARALAGGHVTRRPRRVGGGRRRRRADGGLLGRRRRRRRRDDDDGDSTRRRSAGPTPATASSSTWPSAARRSRCSPSSPRSSTAPTTPRSTAAACSCGRAASRPGWPRR